MSRLWMYPSLMVARMPLPALSFGDDRIAEDADTREGGSKASSRWLVDCAELT
ncbi:hypothetical protein ABIA18_002496 [Sinorhizobium fredii]